MKRRNVLKAIISAPLAALPVGAAGAAVPAKRYPLHKIMRAIEQVESGGDPNAIGDGGEAIGILQLHKTFVDDVNRIEKLIGVEYDPAGGWSYRQRTQALSSRLMFLRWHLYYIVHTGDASAEGIARRHNGGPRGHLKAATLGYWAKVKRELERGAG